ncbi:thiamine pyrophosphate-dependent enzyme [Aquiluna sp.]|nr:thiamine pyrophosphate-dependent enzyme [Aquiluna sp.]MDA8927441.1 thiamine pyrophosphate-dependent enzyme [Aquiluna sp.]
MTKTQRASDQRLAEAAKGIRQRVLGHSLKNNGGYMSQACSAAELLSCIYGGLIDLPEVSEPLLPRPFAGTPGIAGKNRETGIEFHGGRKPDRDRLISSPAHYALVIYAAMIESGRLHEDALNDFNKDGSTVEMIGAEHSPGFETTTGSLAQAISQASGIAIARKIRQETGNTWVFMSDGEFQEGQTWEALQAASFHNLGNLKVIVDVNQGQCDGPMDQVMSIEPLASKIEAFGWEVVRVDGHDTDAIFDAGKTVTDKPLMILCYTDPVRGLPIMQSRFPTLHYLRFTSETEKATYAAAYQEMSK